MATMVNALTSTIFRFQSSDTPSKLNIPSSKISRTNRQRCIDFLIDEVGLPESLRDRKRLWAYGAFRVEGSMLPFELVLGFDPMHYKRPLPDRFLHWKICSRYDLIWAPYMISSFLWQDGRPRKEDIMSSLKGPVSILHWVSFHAGMAFADRIGLGTSSSWQSFFPEILGLCQTGEPHHVLAPQTLPYTGSEGCSSGLVERYSTALFEFLCGRWYQSARRNDGIMGRFLKSGLRTWLNGIKHIYHLDSLENYGRRECQAMEQFLGRAVWNAQDNRYPPPPVLLSIKYGARVRDWGIEWDWKYERFAGEFWQLIESQSPLEATFELPTGMPGSWVKEDPTRSSPVSPSTRPRPEIEEGFMFETQLYIKHRHQNIYVPCNASKVPVGSRPVFWQ